MEKIKGFLAAAVVAAVTFLLIFLQPFYAWDMLVSDQICQRPLVPDKNIFILAVDEKTLDSYGAISTWSRSVSSEVVKILNKEKDKSPAVIGFDIMYLEEGDTIEDSEFANACKEAGNVVTAMNFNFKEQPETDERGKVSYNIFHVDGAQYPYPELMRAGKYGFANTIVDSDGYVRRGKSQLVYQEETVYSLAAQVYNQYMQYHSETPQIPLGDKDNLFSFQYACKTGGYSVISLCDLLDGTVNPEIFSGGIVFVGAYASGMLDSYTPAISHGQQMYGVEIQASIVDAMLHGRIKQDFNLLYYALFFSVLAGIYALLAGKMKTVPAAILMAGLVGGSLVLVKVAYQAGYVIPVLVFPSIICVLYIISMVRGYLAEIKRRRKIIGVFKQYVAPQIVEEISRQKDFKIALGGEKRHIAVLFVDIRGFTTMSENLRPEEVVEILNEYLALTTASIFKNNGTLDKFVGDATMAVFNAPFDLDDYIYHAVKTAWDMKAGADELAEKFSEKYEKSVSFGIGVNCGEAVVGNIGCDFRMDYTAIGDTVNTAARLESNAKRGQILISANVYEAVKDRVTVTEIGEIPLKGKSQGVFVYQVDEVK